MCCGFFQSCNATQVTGCKLRFVKAAEPSGKLRNTIKPLLWEQHRSGVIVFEKNIQSPVRVEVTSQF